MHRVKIFQSNRSQAVRLPKPVAFPKTVKEVDIIEIGQARLIVPAGDAWDSFFDAPFGVTDDFMNSRDQPDDQEREAF